MTRKYLFNKYYNLSNIISLILFIMSIFFLTFKGLNYGVDFKGGTLIELRSDNTNYKTEDIRGAFNKLNLDDLSVKKFGAEGDYVIKFKRSDLNEPDFIKNLKNDLDNYLEDYSFRRVENVGPKVSAELLQDGVTAIAIALAAMLIYIWFRFEWQFSIGAIIAIFHDVIITLGIFSLLSLEINLSIVAAVLTIVGYSMNDTVVIFDRVRENLKKYADIKIFDLTNLSINETLSRTLITSVTTLLALLSIFFFGGEILKGFSFAMILGVILGTYSSIFIANPVLVYFKVSQKTLIKEED
ncbi:protein translocase subunit SecF [Candidatus Pelagibacter sp.]|nr:protein translocase subunit SecF [Candidatus Pelagibacter sp.]